MSGLRWWQRHCKLDSQGETISIKRRSLDAHFLLSVTPGRDEISIRRIGFVQESRSWDSASTGLGERKNGPNPDRRSGPKPPACRQATPLEILYPTSFWKEVDKSRCTGSRTFILIFGCGKSFRNCPPASLISERRAGKRFNRS